MRNLSLKHIKTIIALDKEGKISAAAKSLGLTSPAVTIQLQQMEEELDCQLFIRSRTGIKATEAGKIMLSSAQHIVAELDNLAEQLQSLKGVNAGNIRLGVVSTGKYFVPRIIAAFNKEFPGIKISLVAANRSTILEKLKNFDIDIALMGRTPKEFEVRSTLFGDHPLVFIAPPEHQLANELDIDPEILLDQQFIVREPGSGTRNSFQFFMNSAIASAGHEFAQEPIEMDSNETIKQAVMAGLGLALISGHTIEHECAANKLAILDVTGTPIRRNWFSVTQIARAQTPTLTAFNEFLRKSGPALLPIVSKPYGSSQLLPIE